MGLSLSRLNTTIQEINAHLEGELQPAQVCRLPPCPYILFTILVQRKAVELGIGKEHTHRTERPFQLFTKLFGLNNIRNYINNVYTYIYIIV